jgi:hypothetical protein
MDKTSTPHQRQRAAQPLRVNEPMDKEQKRKLKAQFKQREQDSIRESLPLSIEDLKDLLSCLNREDAPECDHTLREAVRFLEARNLKSQHIVPWLNEHGGFCDCEVVYNVYNDVGDIVGWHLDKRE